MFRFSFKIIEYKSWHSRLAALQILQNFGIFNIFLVKENIRELVKKIVVNSLIDEQLEVRIAASLALTGFIHSHFITVDNDLIVSYINPSLSKIQYHRRV